MTDKHYRELWHQQIKATEQLQAENVLLREALEAIKEDYTFTEALFYGDRASAYSSTACEALNATQRTAKVKAVLDAAIKYVDAGNIEGFRGHEIKKAVRAMEE